MQWTLFLLVLTGQWCLMVCQLYEYHYIKENKTWSDARRYCRDHHTDLATVSTMTDMKRLHDTPMNMNGAWIGLFHQTNGTRECHWSLCGEEFNNSDTNWNIQKGEPNDDNIENCGFIYRDLTWGDISCIRENVTNLSFICFNESESSARFYLIYQNVTWLEAQRYCMENHTGLVSGLEQLQEEKFRRVIENITDKTYPFIGLFKDAWKWSDGSSFSFRYWNLKLDDEVVYNTDQCAMTVFNDGGRWMNDDCNKPKPFICYEDKVILIHKKLNWEEAFTTAEITTMTWSPSPALMIRDGSRRKSRTPRLLMSGLDCATPALWTSGSGSVTRWSPIRTGSQVDHRMTVTCLEPWRQEDSISGSKKMMLRS